MIQLFLSIAVLSNWATDINEKHTYQQKFSWQQQHCVTCMYLGHLSCQLQTPNVAILVQFKVFFAASSLVTSKNNLLNCDLLHVADTGQSNTVSSIYKHNIKLITLLYCLLLMQYMLNLALWSHQQRLQMYTTFQLAIRRYSNKCHFT